MSSEWFKRVSSLFTSVLASDDSTKMERTRLRLERMEDRVVPAVFTVTSLADTGEGTLRQAILEAEATSEADTIRFDTNLSGNIRLTSVGDTTYGASAFTINSDITIDGSNLSDGISITRDTNAARMRLFTVGSTGHLTLQGVTVSNGFAEGSISENNPTGAGLGGAIYNLGRLDLINSTLADNRAEGMDGIEQGPANPDDPTLQVLPPADGRGGAIYNDGGTVNVVGSTISGNRALAGTPLNETPTSEAVAQGGGIFNRNGEVRIESSTLTQNIAANGGRQFFNLADGAEAVAELENSILGQNDLLFTDFEGVAINEGTNNATGGRNLIRTFSGFEGQVTITDDPLLGPLARNGGPTPSHLPAEESPVVDAGETTPGKNGVDQRGSGFKRTSNGRTDLGSVEIQVPLTPTNNQIASGTGAGAAPHVQVFTGSGEILHSFYAYDVEFTGGVKAALGDINGDGVQDVVTVPMSQGGPHVKVFDGVTGQEMMSFFAYTEDVTTGLNLAVGDLDNDGFDDIVVSPRNGVSHVRAFSGATGDEMRSFFAYNVNFTGGASVSVADMNNDGFEDIITGAGAGGGPHVRVFSGQTNREIASFLAINPAFTNGVSVTTGDLDGDGQQDYIVTPGAQSNGVVFFYNGVDRKMMQSVQLFEGLGTGISVTATDVDGDGRDDLIAGAPQGLPGQVRILNTTDGSIMGSIFPYGESLQTGVNL